MPRARNEQPRPETAPRHLIMTLTGLEVKLSDVVRMVAIVGGRAVPSDDPTFMHPLGVRVRFGERSQLHPQGTVVRVYPSNEPPPSKSQPVEEGPVANVGDVDFDKARITIYSDAIEISQPGSVCLLGEVVEVVNVSTLTRDGYKFERRRITPPDSSA